jgi:hypothetical protein
MAKSTPTIDLTFNDNATSIGSESIAYIAPVTGTGEFYKDSAGIVEELKWTRFPTVIKEKLDMEPKTGEILDDRGRVIYSYSQPAKVKYSASIIQRDTETFEFLRKYRNQNFLMWVVVGQIGPNNQEILMYGKLGGNYSEDMSAEPNIPIEFNCEVNPDDITATQPQEKLGIFAANFAEEITIKRGEMVAKKDTLITVKKDDN